MDGWSRCYIEGRGTSERKMWVNDRTHMRLREKETPKALNISL